MARPQTITDVDILRAAREVFVELGPRVSVATVAKRLGVSHSALFQRMGTKQDLLLRALRPEGPPDAVLEVLALGPVSGTPVRRQLLPVLEQLLRFIDDVMPALLVLRSAQLPLGGPAEVTPMPVQLRSALADWLRRARDESLVDLASPGAVAEGLLGAIEARALNRHLGGAAYVLGDDESFLLEILHGLVPTSSEPDRSNERGER